MSVRNITTSDGLRIVGEEAGNPAGPPVLLIAGTTMARAMWAPTVAGLADRYRVITFDSRDVGDADRARQPYDSARIAEDAISVLDAFGVDRVQAAGFSLGGCVALQIALRHPDRLISLSTASCWARVDEHLRRQFSFWKELVETCGWDLQFKMMAFMSFSNETLELLGGQIDLIGKGMAATFDKAAFLRQVDVDLTHSLSDEELGRIRAPLLALWGTADLLVPRKHARELAAAVPGAEYGEIEGVSHSVTIDHPDRYIAILRNWFARHA
jgi:pimeloyl-ACP methyl ester carboxylesterase